MSRVFRSRDDAEMTAQYFCDLSKSACRNPVAHEPRVLWAGKDEDALDSLVLISLFHKNG